MGAWVYIWDKSHGPMVNEKGLHTFGEIDSECSTIVPYQQQFV